LYLPNEKVLITGDAVSYPVPYVSAHPREQAESLAALARLDVEVIVPGHGPAFHDKSFLALELRLIDSVLKGVREGLRGGAQNLAELQRAVTVDELRDAFAHGDVDLESRFRDRVGFLVKVASHEYGQQY
jgi:glyoxylase-like metal-dependent hydrolase (beta-lactamase superfamily II)